jgi:hypothetical protein
MVSRCEDVRLNLFKLMASANLVLCPISNMSVRVVMMCAAATSHAFIDNEGRERTSS